MSKVNFDVSLDPDFGNIVPPVECSYWVTVLPEDKSIMPFRFVLMMPLITNYEEEELYIGEAIFQLIGEESTCRVKQLDDDDFKKISKSTIVASFKPDNPEEFCFIRPPRMLMN